MGKKSFVLGALVGFVLGSRAGREQYEKIKNVSQDLWNSDPVQAGVAKVEDTVGGAARGHASNLTDKVADLVKDRINTAGKKPAHDDMAGHVSGGDKPMEPAEPGPHA